MKNQSKRVEARMPLDLYKRLVAAAKRQNISASQIINLFVRRGLNKK